YIDAAQRSPPSNIPTLPSSTSRLISPELVFCTIDMSRVLEDYSTEAILEEVKKIKNIVETKKVPGTRVL
ncbi:hypothetical protein P885DRAFT_43551, partial [Corynascus similis CBS 632.67]